MSDVISVCINRIQTIGSLLISQCQPIKTMKENTYTLTENDRFEMSVSLCIIFSVVKNKRKIVLFHSFFESLYCKVMYGLCRNSG